MQTRIILLVLTFLGASGEIVAQTSADSKKLVRQFIEYTMGEWNIDTVVSKYVLFRDEESKVATKEQRKRYIGMAITQLASEATKYNIDPGELTVDTYEQADASLQILNLGLDYSNRAYVVSNKPKSFVRYFLIRNRRIEAFVLYRNRAFLLLN